MDPKPVRVVYPNGAEQLGIALSESELDVGPIGMFVELWDVLEIDGERREVTGLKTNVKSPGSVGVPESFGWEAATRITHRAPVPPQVSWEEREKRAAGREALRLERESDPTRAPGPRAPNDPFRTAGRNDPCPCGSGKKFKNCHLGLV